MFFIYIRYAASYTSYNDLHNSEHFYLRVPYYYACWPQTRFRYNTLINKKFSLRVKIFPDLWMRTLYTRFLNPFTETFRRFVDTPLYFAFERIYTRNRNTLFYFPFTRYTASKYLLTFSRENTGVYKKYNSFRLSIKPLLFFFIRAFVVL